MRLKAALKISAVEHALDGNDKSAATAVVTSGNTRWMIVNSKAEKVLRLYKEVEVNEVYAGTKEKAWKGLRWWSN